MVNECFVLSSTDLAALFAEDWPADYTPSEGRSSGVDLFYTVAGYEFFPGGRVSTYLDDITALSMRLGLEPRNRWQAYPLATS